jgi:hypothetical protein
MSHPAALKPVRLAIALLALAALWGCGPGDDKSKTEKKVETPPPPKVTPPPAPPKKKEEVKAAPKAAASAEGWVLLGEQQVDHKTESDRFVIGNKTGKFRQLRVTVQGAPVTIDRMVVTFSDNKQVTPNLRHDFKENSHSRDIDLPGEARALKEVEFTYRSTGATGTKATVALYGR